MVKERKQRNPENQKQRQDIVMSNKVLTFEALQDFLTDNDLMIAPRVLVEDRIKQNDILKKKYLTIPELYKSRLFPNVRTHQTFRNWCKNGTWKEDIDWYKNKKGRTMILMSSIKKKLKIS